jgi:hypothetical protein
MAVALQLCSPLERLDPPSDFIDPLPRCVQAFLFGELDPAFENFTVWELRGVVNARVSWAIDPQQFIWMILSGVIATLSGPMSSKRN